MAIFSGDHRSSSKTTRRSSGGSAVSNRHLSGGGISLTGIYGEGREFCAAVGSFMASETKIGQTVVYGTPHVMRSSTQKGVRSSGGKLRLNNDGRS